jgi:hypothetical protein
MLATEGMNDWINWNNFNLDFEIQFKEKSHQMITSGISVYMFWKCAILNMV